MWGHTDLKTHLVGSTGRIESVCSTHKQRFVVLLEKNFDEIMAFILKESTSDVFKMSLKSLFMFSVFGEQPQATVKDRKIFTRRCFKITKFTVCVCVLSTLCLPFILQVSTSACLDFHVSFCGRDEMNSDMLRYSVWHVVLCFLSVSRPPHE